MSEKQAFIQRALMEDVTMTALCREYGISRKTGYKWLRRYREAGVAGLSEQPRRPHHSPQQTSPEVEHLVVELRQQHPAWGARKLKKRLEAQGHVMPACSTVHAILRRHGLLDDSQSAQHRAFQRFERESPNELWQMDFKSPVQTSDGAVCQPLTVLDDHSRFLVCLQACPNQQARTVEQRLIHVFEVYGLPEAMLMDNGPPWGNTQDQTHTAFTVWLMRLGIRVCHGRPYHPQTQGKLERLHRSLDEEVISRTSLPTFGHCQPVFDDWRQVYNSHRPHAALDLATPHTRYLPSSRPYPLHLPPLSYPSPMLVRKVDSAARISLHGRSIRVGKAFRGYYVGLLPDPLQDGHVDLYFATTKIRTLDLRQKET